MTTVSEIFEAMATQVESDRLDGIDVVIGWALSGDESTEKTMSIADGSLSVEDGLSDSANATISMDSDDFKDMMSGELNPMMAFMGGKVKIDGDMSAVMKIQGLMGQFPTLNQTKFDQKPVALCCRLFCYLRAFSQQNAPIYTKIMGHELNTCEERISNH